MRIANEDDVPSPALLIYPERIGENVRRQFEPLLVGANRQRLEGIAEIVAETEVDQVKIEFARLDL